MLTSNIVLMLIQKPRNHGIDKRRGTSNVSQIFSGQLLKGNETMQKKTTTVINNIYTAGISKLHGSAYYVNCGTFILKN